MSNARIQVHDFSGHPFQADLSRELARRGYYVDHVFSTQYSSGKDRLEIDAVMNPAPAIPSRKIVSTTFQWHRTVPKSCRMSAKAFLAQRVARAH